MVGLDIHVKAHESACHNAKKYGLDGRMEFVRCSPDESLSHTGQYDAVFIKTVLYNSKTLDEYGRWLNWILSVLKPGGFLINFETGRANELMQLYRRMRKRSYTDLCLYTSKVEELYDERFQILYRKYYGGLSQFLSPFGRLYCFAYRLEEAMRRRGADNCFVASIIARKSNQ